MIGHFILRLTLWLLLTANFGIVNVLIGIAIALLLPRRATSPERLGDLLQGVFKIIVAIPQAYWEAIQLILRPHRQEAILMEPVPPQRFSARGRVPTPGLIFLDIFLITFTPKTTVLKYHEEGYYEVHHVRRREPS
jgi:multicomponent Na+:H+ antiporter subunit E